MTQYQWNAIDGTWDVAGDWLDVTDGNVAASAAPGPADSAVIDGASVATIAGPGSSANLTMFTDLALQGAFNTGGVTIGSTDGFAELSLSEGSICAGTRILTNRGDVPVEWLQAGEAASHFHHAARI